MTTVLREGKDSIIDSSPLQYQILSMKIEDATEQMSRLVNSWKRLGRGTHVHHNHTMLNIVQ